MDTPGYLDSGVQFNKRLNRDLMTSSTTSVTSQDITDTLIIVDAARALDERVKGSLSSLIALAKREREIGVNNNREFAIVLNKIDLVRPKSDLLTIAGEVCSEQGK